MLPNLDVTTTSTVATLAAPGTPVPASAPRRQENDRAVEAYRAVREKRDNEDVALRREERSAGSEAVVAAAREKKAAEKAEKKSSEARDQADINLQLTREERDALASAFGSDEKKARMTDEERETAKKASERIVKYLDEAIARNKESRGKMEKAISEWYSRLSKGEDWGATDLISLFRQAAAGQLDETQV